MSSLIAALVSTWKCNCGQHSEDKTSHISVSTMSQIKPPVQVGEWGPWAVSISSGIFRSKVCFGYSSKQDLNIWEPHWYNCFQTPSGTELVSAPDRLRRTCMQDTAAIDPNSKICSGISLSFLLTPLSSSPKSKLHRKQYRSKERKWA